MNIDKLIKNTPAELIRAFELRRLNGETLRSIHTAHKKATRKVSILTAFYYIGFFGVTFGSMAGIFIFNQQIASLDAADFSVAGVVCIGVLLYAIIKFTLDRRSRLAPIINRCELEFSLFEQALQCLCSPTATEINFGELTTDSIRNRSIALAKSVLEAEEKFNRACEPSNREANAVKATIEELLLKRSHYQRLWSTIEELGLNNIGTSKEIFNVARIELYRRKTI